jgi:hypothetical protein
MREIAIERRIGVNADLIFPRSGEVKVTHLE